MPPRVSRGSRPELVDEVGVGHDDALGVARAPGRVLYDGWIRELGLVWVGGALGASF